MKTFAKDPDARLDYTVDWTAFLTGSSDTVSTYSFVSPSVDLTFEDEAMLDGMHTIFISGGTLNEVYLVTSRIETTGGRINDSSFRLLIRET